MAENKKYTRAEYVYLSKMSEKLERYDEMMGFVDKFLELGYELDVEQRTIVATAYKNVVGNRRAELRVLNAIEQKEQRKGNDTHLKYIKNYKDIIEKELRSYCNTLLELIDKHLLNVSKDLETKVFFFKMQGDYNRYLCEFVQDEEYNLASEKALEGYTEAQNLCEQFKLEATNPIRLGLQLNLSVFYYEITQDLDKACSTAKIAFDSALAEISNVKEDNYKDCTLIMQLLKDNLTLWTSDIPAEETNNDEF